MDQNDSTDSIFQAHRGEYDQKREELRAHFSPSSVRPDEYAEDGEDFDDLNALTDDETQVLLETIKRVQSLRYKEIIEQAEQFESRSASSLSGAEAIGGLSIQSGSSAASLHENECINDEFNYYPPVYPRSIAQSRSDQASVGTSVKLVPYAASTSSVDSVPTVFSQPINRQKLPQPIPPQAENQPLTEAQIIRPVDVDALSFKSFNPFAVYKQLSQTETADFSYDQQLVKPPKVKIQRPVWPPIDGVIKNFEPTDDHNVQASKCRKYIPAARDINELIKQDNRCALLYGRTHDVDDDYECNVSAETVPRVTEWLGFAFPPQLNRLIIDKFRFASPRKCQQIVIPLLLSGYDVVCRMENASGKTMAYVLPMFAILNDRLKEGSYQRSNIKDLASYPFALIIANTRELTTQIFEQVNKCNLGFGFKISRCIGEFDRAVNAQELQRGVDIVVATPGRLRDMVQSGFLQLSELQYIVFDEADQVISPGFYDTLNPVFQKFPDITKRQMSFFGATMNTNVDLGQFLRHGYATVANLTYKIAPRLKFSFSFVQRRTRYSSFLAGYIVTNITDVEEHATKTLIFMRTISECNMMRDYLKSVLKYDNIFSLNSSKNQSQRDEIVTKLRDPETTADLIVFTTSLMARGIDIPEVNHVIHFSVEDFDDFVNRSGRTGRLSEGHVHVLIDRDVSIQNVKQIRNSLLSIQHDIPSEIDLFIGSKWNQIQFI